MSSLKVFVLRIVPRYELVSVQYRELVGVFLLDHGLGSVFSGMQSVHSKRRRLRLEIIIASFVLESSHKQIGAASAIPTTCRCHVSVLNLLLIDSNKLESVRSCL